MTVFDSGYVGIGTVSPSSRLYVQGSGATSATSALNVVNSSGTSALFVRNDGNVGIGTVSPSVLLEARNSVNLGSGFNTITRITGTTWTASGNIGIDFYNKNDEYQMAYIGAQPGLSYNRPILTFATNDYLHASGLQTRMVINEYGNVGIGTTSPFAKLSVVGDVVADYFNATSTTATSTFAGGFAVGTNKLVVDRSTGNVGVGTASPAYNLDIVGAGAQARLYDSGANSPVAYRVRNTGSQGFFGIEGSSGGQWLTNALPDYFEVGNFSAYGMHIGTNNSVKFTIDSTGNTYIGQNGGITTATMVIQNQGNVGIGTTTPSAKLDIYQGNLNLDNTTSANQYGVISKGGTRFIHNFNYGNNGTVTTEGGNTFVGEEAGNLTMGNTATQTYHSGRNTAIGKRSLYSNTIGYNNTANGYFSLYSNTIGDNNTANGVNSLYNNTAGSFNVVNGVQSLYSNTTGSYNVAFGHQAGRYQADGTTALTDPENSVYLGYGTRGFSNADSNSIVIGYNAIGIGANSVVLGNDSITTTALKGNVGIGTTSPSQLLTVGNNNQFTVDSSGNVNATSYLLGSNKGMSLVSGDTFLQGASTLYFAVGGNTTAYFQSSIFSPLVSKDNMVALGGLTSRWSSLAVGTGGATIAGNVGIGTTSPFAKLSVVGDVVADYFNATSTTATSTFAGGFAVGTNKLVVDRSTGNVGIGTASPSSSLTIYTANDNGLELQNAGSASKSWKLKSNGNDLMIGETGLGNRVTFQAGGNVGIGTTSPFAKLSVKGAGTTTGINFQTTNSNDTPLVTVLDSGKVGIGTASPTSLLTLSSNSTAGTLFDFENSDTGGSTWRFNSTGSGNTGGAGNFLISEAGVGGRFSIQKTTGNVGIGTTSPFAKLSVKGAGTTTGINFQTTNSNDTPLVTVLDSGNVGIGTASPTAKLEVAGNGENFQILPGYGVSGDAVGTWLMTKASSWTLAPSADGVAGKKVVGVAYNGSTWHSMFEYANVGSGEPNLLLVKSGGNVGIGTTTPWRTLSVNGTAAFTGLTNNGTGYYACVSTTGELATSTTACGASSERFKTNINDLTYGLDTVLQLRPVSFNWKSDFINSSSTQIGFIAEEVGLLIPEVIGHDDKGTIMNLDYPKLTSVLVNAIKEINTKISAIASSTPTVSTGVVDSVLSHLESLGAKFVDGIAYFKDVVVKTLTAEKVITNGIEMVDEVTGEIYCVRIQNGAMVNVPGECTTTANTQQPTVSSNTTAPVITITGNNPAVVEINSNYIDLGATAVDYQGNSLIVDTHDLDTVDTTTAGEYIITYTAFDGTNTSTSTRTVLVEEVIVVSPESISTESVVDSVESIEQTTTTEPAEPTATTTDPVVEPIATTTEPVL